MVDDLFELSRIHAGVLQPVAAAVALGDLVSEAIAAADPVARARGVRLGGTVEEGIEVTARPGRAVPGDLQPGDERDPAHPGRRRRSRSAAAPCRRRVELSVADGCGGIAEEDMARVFDVAWQGSAARTPDTDRTAGRRGAGLGLAIVQGHRGGPPRHGRGRERGPPAAGSVVLPSRPEPDTPRVRLTGSNTCSG